MKIYEVPTQLVEELWPAASPLLARALKFHPYVDVAGLLKIILARRATLIVCVRDAEIVGAVVMEEVQYPSERVANVIAIAGKFGTYRAYKYAVADYLEAWSRARGCHKIGSVGRPGWRKALQQRGWIVQPCVVASFTL